MECLDGNAARDALKNKSDANADAYLFYYEYPPDGVPRVVRIAQPIIENLPGESDSMHGADWYVIDRNFTWTYVRTHESDLGPYFCERNK